MVLVIAGAPEGDVLERWTFDVHTDKDAKAGTAPPPEKDEAEIVAEIQAIIRQITASVTFLPLLNRACACARGRGGGEGLRQRKDRQGRERARDEG